MLGRRRRRGVDEPLFEYPSGRGRSHDLRGSCPIVAFDIETTGLNRSSDRIVELAAVRLDRDGEIEAEWCSLVNPGCDVGPTFIHHITNEMVADSPSLGDVIGVPLALFDGAIVVSHFAQFEEGFLRAELARLGLQIPPVPAVCTRELAREMFPLPNHRLGTCLDYAGLLEADTGGALGDARAKALLAHDLMSDPNLDLTWPNEPTTLAAVPVRRSPHTRVTGLRKGEHGWMAGILAKLPISTEDHEEEAKDVYVTYLAHALADGKLTGDEAKALGRLAGSAPEIPEAERRLLSAIGLTVGSSLTRSCRVAIVTDDTRAERIDRARELGVSVVHRRDLVELRAGADADLGRWDPPGGKRALPPWATPAEM